ncbi:MAG: transposase, partial [Alphaproteobacteria bacterium]|nr:transposase [Alphaproteobacteria bacterium]
KVGVSTQAIEKIASLYGVEKKARESELNFDEVKTLRGKESQPILDDLKKFLEKHQGLAPPKSTLGEAIGYTLRRWKELNVYLEDGSLSIDNNEVERCIRPFAVGQKNWLFKGSVKGAEASAVIYSLLESAKSYGLNPFDYFEDILKKIPLGEKLENLLPYNWKQPADKA